ncbi:MAG: hypothetical protein H0V17_20365, partial [Deltaproteobacteria bacterium]|nr:hypothetical protein [Deltaproteobacteria bacterium]
MKRPFSPFLAATLVVSAIASGAAASPLADALTRHGDKDVIVLRGQLADVSSRCTLGAVYAQRNDLTRAALYLTGCSDADLPADIASPVARIDRDVKKRLRDSDLAMIEVVTDPAGMTATIDALPGDTFTTPATLYLPAGDYEVKATKDGRVLSNVVHVIKRSRGAVVLESGSTHIVPPSKKPGVIDMTENGSALDDQHTAPPPALKHKNLMPGKYQRGMAVVATAENPDAIDDPMAVREARASSARTYWLGLRLGGGMFDDNASAARAGVAVAATGRYA